MHKDEYKKLKERIYRAGFTSLQQFAEHIDCSYQTLRMWGVRGLPKQQIATYIRAIDALQKIEQSRESLRTEIR